MCRFSFRAREAVLVIQSDENSLRVVIRSLVKVAISTRLHGYSHLAPLTRCQSPCCGDKDMEENSCNDEMVERQSYIYKIEEKTAAPLPLLLPSDETTCQSLFTSTAAALRYRSTLLGDSASIPSSTCVKTSTLRSEVCCNRL